MARLIRTASPALSDARRDVAAEQVRVLSEPDFRGICSDNGLPDHRSPEMSIVKFWEGVSHGGWPRVSRFFLAETGQDFARKVGRLPRPATVSSFSVLAGNERRISAQYQIDIAAPGRPVDSRCAISRLAFAPSGWFLESVPVVLRDNCQ